MLGKLFKYEIKATARLFIPLYLTILIFAVINRFLFVIPKMGENAFSFVSFAMSISMIVYVTLMLGLVLMSFIVMIQRFYKSLLGDEGYLMFTLPVQTQKHIYSKLGVSMLWIIISGIVALCSILIIASKNIAVSELFTNLTEAFNLFTQNFGAQAYLAVFQVIILVLLSLASAILNIYAAIALGHLFNKYKLLISFGMYIVLRTVPQILLMLLALIFSGLQAFGAEMSLLPNVMQINGIILLSILFSGVITVGYFILTNYILKRKLNLE